MDIISYTEAVAAKSLEVARHAYDDLHERAYKLTTVLVTGGGAVGALALSRIGSPTGSIGWAPLAALALSWFAIAGLLVLGGATSKLLSPGNGPKHLRDYFAARLKEYPDDREKALEITRGAELDLMQKRLRAYTDGCTARAHAIDRAYRSVALCSPLVPLVVASACWLLERGAR